MGIKDLLLNKGWAGRTISRAETIDRLNPVIHALTVLMHMYDAACRALPGEDSAGIEVAQKLLRADIGKLAETVFSCGGTAFSGVDLEASDFSVEGARTAVAQTLASAETTFRAVLDGEQSVDHQIRTRAVLAAVAHNSSERMHLVREMSRH